MHHPEYVYSTLGGGVHGEGAASNGCDLVSPALQPENVGIQDAGGLCSTLSITALIIPEVETHMV